MSRNVKLYLDTCVYCRPFDDQSQIGIARETDAFVSILDSDFLIVGSDVLEDEVSWIEVKDKRIEIRSFLGVCREHVSLSDMVVEKAAALVSA